MAKNLTEVRLLNVPLDNKHINTIYFTTREKQISYFSNKVIDNGTATNCSYQRENNMIRFPAIKEDILSCNYVMYKNAGYKDKWFYAFVTNMEYKDDGRTDIYIKTDPMQTWLVGLDYNLLSCFVEREHVNDDTVGLHTVPECVETGEYICNELVRDTKLQDYTYIVQFTETSEGNPHYATNYGGVWCSGGAYLCPNGVAVADIVNMYANAGKLDAITNVYIVPSAIITQGDDTLTYTGQNSPTTYEVEFAKQTTLNGYTPRNKKLLTHPYNYILLSNNCGSSNVLQYEHFSTNTCKFEVAGVPSVGASVKCAPLNYKGLERMQQEGLLLGKFPTCSWSGDLYTNWLTQNGVNIGLGVASGGLQVVGGLASMSTGAGAIAGVGMVASGIMSVAQTVGQVYQHSFTPNSAEGNTNGGDINTCYKMNIFYFHKMSIKKEYARIIDEYFDMYGYKVNRVKVPNINHRERWWYTKTIDANIKGNIPMQDLMEIKDCFNRGITFWKNGDSIGYYAYSNDIVTE